MHRLINYRELVKGSWSSVKNQCHHLVTDTQRGPSNRTNVSSPHLCRVMMCDKLCSSELSHHNLSHNLPSAQSTGDTTSAGVDPPLMENRGQASKQHNKTNVLPKRVKPTPKATVGWDWILHTSFTASWSPPHLTAGKHKTDNFILN